MPNGESLDFIWVFVKADHTSDSIRTEIFVRHHTAIMSNDRNFRKSTLFVRDAIKSKVPFQDIFVGKAKLIDEEKLSWAAAKKLNRRRANSVHRRVHVHQHEGRQAQPPPRLKAKPTPTARGTRVRRIEVLILVAYWFFFIKRATSIFKSF